MLAVSVGERASFYVGARLGAGGGLKDMGEGSLIYC